ncbi:MAG: QacE family quaternary ammonium compound efflux SMR transporter [Actinomycetales bacterium]|nr:QacE family quaternary ammonium compound efflux SMR transporter [Actinomycetales bacterium]
MAWIVLALSGALETVWAVALAQSNGLRRWRPVAVFASAMTISMAGLAYAVRQIPIGMAYAVWTGIGASLTVAWAMATGAETAPLLKVIVIVGIIGATLGLRFTEDT